MSAIMQEIRTLLSNRKATWTRLKDQAFAQGDPAKLSEAEAILADITAAEAMLLQPED